MDVGIEVAIIGLVGVFVVGYITSIFGLGSFILNSLIIALSSIGIAGLVAIFAPLLQR